MKIDGETVKTVRDFILGGSKITADGDCSHELKRHLLLGRKIMTKGDQPWDYFGRTYAKAETPILLPPHEKSWLFGKDSDAGRDWGQEMGMTEDEMAGWHHWLDGRESEWTPEVGNGQGNLPVFMDSAYCDSQKRAQIRKLYELQMLSMCIGCWHWLTF